MTVPRADVPDAERRIYRYVLGQLAGPELEELEDRLIAEQAVFEQVEAVEIQVCDDYAADRLNPADREAFSERLQVNDRLQRRVAMSRALTAGASGPVRTTPAAARWGWLAIAAGLAAIAVAALWFALRDRASEPDVVVVQTPVATPPAATPPTVTPGNPPTVTPSPPAVLATLTLFGPVVRDTAQIPVVTLPAGEGIVRIEVALTDGDVFPVYRADLRRGQEQISSGVLRELRTRDGRLVVADVPAAALAAGLYQIDVFGVRGSDASRIASYPFRVAR